MLSLNYRSSQPLHLQVQEGLRHLIVTGTIREGEKLPSVRALASSLAINPNTIQRAYEALEAEGYLVSEAGKGSFAARREQVGRERRERLLHTFDETAGELLFLGMTAQDLALRLRDAEKGAQREEKEENP
ncbi:MAG: GntR family transcriptional regulator [Oscillospiraceae bacterium]|nr:GntR family transcriptional regulator [Oscillospiraceae bacterium]